MQCSVFIATSLDGYIARPDGGLDWLGIVNAPGEDYGYAEFAATVDAIILGRSTYDIVRGFGPDAWQYKGKRVIVLTNRPGDSVHGEEFVTGNAADLAGTLRRDGHQRIYVDGGQVIRQFMAAGLVDDYTISLIPVILGDGIRLFDKGGEHGVVLEEVKHWPTGLVQLRYRKR